MRGTADEAARTWVPPLEGMGNARRTDDANSVNAMDGKEPTVMIIPTPMPVYTLSPALEDIDTPTFAAIERCVSSLAGYVEAVLVTSLGWTDRHVVIEMETPLGPMLMLELMNPVAS